MILSIYISQQDTINHMKKTGTIQILSRRPKYSQNFINEDRRSNSFMSRLAICHASKRRVCIQKIYGDALASKTCNLCYNIPTNHYCRYTLPQSNVMIENEELEICGFVSCFECREKWGST